MDWICGKCGKRFARFEELTNHVYEELHETFDNDKEIWECALCGKKYTQFYKLKQHIWENH